MQVKRVIVVSIDRLGAAWLGPYGNTWLETPAFSNLVPDPPHAASLPALADDAGLSSAVLTDDAEVAALAKSAGFGRQELMPNSAVLGNAESIEQTQLYRFFEAACAFIRSAEAPQFLWLHSKGMDAPWDAPLELRYQFADEDDPTPPDFVDPPQADLGEDFDPDEPLGYVQAYAGQVALADLCLGMLIDTLDEHPQADESLLIVTSPRGYPLGEHGRVGPAGAGLYGELLHVPLLVRFPGRQSALARSQQLTQPQQVFSLLARALGDCVIGPEAGGQLDFEGISDSPDFHCRAVSAGTQQRSIRTAAWFMRESANAAGNSEHVRRELYAKPDDRWEANEVSSRCGEVVELLAAELDRFSAAAASGQLSESPPLAELLYDTWR
jgi:arylsulfatase A-like enzyme